MKSYKYFGEDSYKQDLLFHVMEILASRYHLIDSRADIGSRLSVVMRNLGSADVRTLVKNLKHKTNESWSWRDAKMKEVLNGSMYGNSMLRYILWRYENSLQDKDIVWTANAR